VFFFAVVVGARMIFFLRPASPLTVSVRGAAGYTKGKITRQFVSVERGQHAPKLNLNFQENAAKKKKTVSECPRKRNWKPNLTAATAYVKKSVVCQWRRSSGTRTSNLFSSSAVIFPSLALTAVSISGKLLGAGARSLGKFRSALS
jgi:hypothetical protein